MAIAHGILVLLINNSASGYELAKQFETSVGFFWKATYQQIYRELAKLENLGWISSQRIAQETRPDKRLYTITELGKQQLIQWMHSECEPTAIKDNLLIKIFAGYLIPEQKIIEELEHHRHLHAQKLKTYQAIEQQYFQNPQTLAKEQKFRYLTLRKGIGYEKDWITWCEEAIALLKSET